MCLDPTSNLKISRTICLPLWKNIYLICRPPPHHVFSLGGPVPRRTSKTRSPKNLSTLAKNKTTESTPKPLETRKRPACTHVSSALAHRSSRALEMSRMGRCSDRSAQRGVCSGAAKRGQPRSQLKRCLETTAQEEAAEGRAKRHESGEARRRR